MTQTTPDFVPPPVLPSDLHRRILELHVWQPQYRWSIGTLCEHVEGGAVAIRAARDWLLQKQLLCADGSTIKPTPRGIGAAGPPPDGARDPKGSVVDVHQDDDEPPFMKAVLVQGSPRPVGPVEKDLAVEPVGTESVPSPTPQKVPILTDRLWAMLRLIEPSPGLTCSGYAKIIGGGQSGAGILYLLQTLLKLGLVRSTTEKGTGGQWALTDYGRFAISAHQGDWPGVEILRPSRGLQQTKAVKPPSKPVKAVQPTPEPVKPPPPSAKPEGLLSEELLGTGKDVATISPPTRQEPERPVTPAPEPERNVTERPRNYVGMVLDDLRRELAVLEPRVSKLTAAIAALEAL